MQEHEEKGKRPAWVLGYHEQMYYVICVFSAWKSHCEVKYIFRHISLCYMVKLQKYSSKKGQPSVCVFVDKPTFEPGGAVRPRNA